MSRYSERARTHGGQETITLLLATCITDPTLPGSETETDSQPEPNPKYTHREKHQEWDAFLTLQNSEINKPEQRRK